MEKDDKIYAQIAIAIGVTAVVGLIVYILYNEIQKKKLKEGERKSDSNDFRLEFQHLHARFDNIEEAIEAIQNFDQSEDSSEVIIQGATPEEVLASLPEYVQAYPGMLEQIQQECAKLIGQPSQKEETTKGERSAEETPIEDKRSKVKATQTWINYHDKIDWHYSKDQLINTFLPLTEIKLKGNKPVVFYDDLMDILRNSFSCFEEPPQKLDKITANCNQKTLKYFIYLVFEAYAKPHRVPKMQYVRLLLDYFTNFKDISPQVIYKTMSDQPSKKFRIDLPEL
ncbi:MAG: hypothetical protein AAF502_17180 [Bacteroidota bacterium]